MPNTAQGNHRKQCSMMQTCNVHIDGTVPANTHNKFAILFLFHKVI